MADNRIYLRCNSCGKTLFLGKRLGLGYWYENYSPEDGTLDEQLNRFYDEHEYCHGAGLDCFDIEYEDEESHWRKEDEDME